MKLFISPHTDDEALFGSFTLLREKPIIAIVFDGYVQEKRGARVNADQRRAETLAAMQIFGLSHHVRFLEFRDDDPTVTAAAIRRRIESMNASEIYAPAIEPGGHHQHNLVGQACEGLPVAHRYLTYTPAGKSISAQEVPICDGSWIGLKLRALACYESQHALDPRLGCWPHFLRDQREYYAA